MNMIYIIHDIKTDFFWPVVNFNLLDPIDTSMGIRHRYINLSIHNEKLSKTLFT